MPDQDEPDDDEQLFMVEDIDPESWHVRQVYAKFGLALYQGQCLEYEIINLIIWSGISIGTYASRQETETANVELFRKTMGALKTVMLRRRIDLGHLEDDLINAVTLRNFLAHNYFRERVSAFMTQEGRKKMMAELDAAVAFFEQVDATLTPFTNRIIESFGLLDKMPEILKEAEAKKGFGQPLPGLS